MKLSEEDNGFVESVVPRQQIGLALKQDQQQRKNGVDENGRVMFRADEYRTGVSDEGKYIDS